MSGLKIKSSVRTSIVSLAAFFLLTAMMIFAGMPISVNAATIMDNGDYVFRVLEDGKSAEVIQYNGKSLYVSLPSTVDKYKVTKVGAAAFMSNKTIKELEIPGSVEIIGSNAFAGCTGLKKLEINGSVETVGECAFMNCSSLETAVIREGVMNIEESAFSGCNLLKSIELPESIIKIGKFAFLNCSSLESITIPQTIKELGGYALEGTKWINNQKSDFVTVSNGILIKYNGKEKARSLPNSIKQIGDCAFAGDTGINTVLIPNTVTKIGSSAFEGCTSLQTVTLPPSVTSIGSSAFAGCTALEMIELPSRLKQLSHDIFANCESLTGITIPASVEVIEPSAFSGCRNLKNLKLQNGIKSIQELAFSECISLGRVVFPESLKDLYTATFLDCINLTRVEFNGDTELPVLAFNGCKNLKEVVFYRVPSNISEYAFSGIKDITFYSDNNFYVEDFARKQKYNSENIKNLPPYEDKGIIDELSKNEDEGGFSGSYTLIVVIIVIADVALIVLFSLYLLFFSGKKKNVRGADKNVPSERQKTAKPQTAHTDRTAPKRPQNRTQYGAQSRPQSRPQGGTQSRGEQSGRSDRRPGQ